MKVSRLINELIKLKKEHGDIEVYAEDPDYGDGGAYEVTQARLHGDGDAVVIWHGTGRWCKQCGRGCD